MKFTDRQCAEAQEGISAMLDGAVGVAEEASLRRHMNSCLRCAAYERSLHELEAQIRGHLNEQCDEERIWTRVLARMDTYGDDRVVLTDAARRQISHPFWRWAAAVVLVCGLALGGWYTLRSGDTDRSILAATVEDFGEFRSTGDVLDVSGSHPDAITRWMTARIDFKLPEGIAAPPGLRIAGGRLCSFLSRKLAFFSYSAGSEDVGLYITQADGLDVPQDGGIAAIARNNGLSAVSWHSDGLAYVAVSDLPIGDLTVVAEEFRKGAVPDL